MAAEERIQLMHPDPDKEAPRIIKSKYDMVRDAILRIVPREENGVPFQDLADLVAEQLTPESRDYLGSIGWYATTVKLDLEARGLVERVPGKSPQHLRRPAS